jgi:hypothetical protein
MDDGRKLEILRAVFREILFAMDDPKYPLWTRKLGMPVMLAASEACMYTGWYGPVVRKYYAFMGDFSQVWFTRDALAAIPDCVFSCRDRSEMQFAIRFIAKELLNEASPGLGEYFKL